MAKSAPLEGPLARLPRRLRARLVALGSSALPGRGRAPDAQPVPRMLELAASKAAHFAAFDHVGGTNDGGRGSQLSSALQATPER